MTDPSPIETIRVPVTTTSHRVEVTEEYRWLEDATSEETQAWTKGQHERTMAYLTALQSYDDIRRRAEEILKADSTSHADPRKAGGTYFALKYEPPKQQPFLVSFADLGDTATERVLVDPNAIDPSGATTIDRYAPSPDGRLVAVSLSSHGTEEGTLHLHDASTGGLVDVRIPRVNSGPAGGSMPGGRTRPGSGIRATLRPASARTKTGTSTKRSGSTRSAARPRTAGTSPIPSRTIGSSRTVVVLPGRPLVLVCDGHLRVTLECSSACCEVLPAEGILSELVEGYAIDRLVLPATLSGQPRREDVPVDAG